MKRTILFLAVMLLSLGAMAQTWRVVKTDGTVLNIPATAISYVTIVPTTDDQSGSIDGHEYVDLGLPSGTLWATCNIGASKPEDFGDYFAWGETTTKETYDWASYKYCNGDAEEMTKYCGWWGYYDFWDNLTELEPEDDAAYVNWDTDWRMPSREQIEELLNSEFATTE